MKTDKFNSSLRIELFNFLKGGDEKSQIYLVVFAFPLYPFTWLRSCNFKEFEGGGRSIICLWTDPSKSEFISR
jgi:hypothetical protein